MSRNRTPAAAALRRRPPAPRTQRSRAEFPGSSAPQEEQSCRLSIRREAPVLLACSSYRTPISDTGQGRAKTRVVYFKRSRRAGRFIFVIRAFAVAHGRRCGSRSSVFLFIARMRPVRHRRSASAAHAVALRAPQWHALGRVQLRWLAGHGTHITQYSRHGHRPRLRRLGKGHGGAAGLQGPDAGTRPGHQSIPAGRRRLRKLGRVGAPRGVRRHVRHRGAPRQVAP